MSDKYKSALRSQPVVAKAGPAKRSRKGLWYGGLIALFVAFSYLAFSQKSRLNPYADVSLFERVFYPIERNGFARLPLITGKINAVYAIPNTTVIWLVGDGGLILHSADNGHTWQQKTFPQGPELASVPPVHPFAGFTIVEAAYAGAEAKRQPPPQQKKQDVLRNSLSEQNGIPASLVDKVDVDKSQNDTEASKYGAAYNPFQNSGLSDGQGELREETAPKLPLSSAQQKSELLPVEAKQNIPEEAVEQGQIEAEPGWIPGLNAVYFRDSKQGVIVGDAGLVLMTSNGGATWRVVDGTGATALFDAVITPYGVIAVGAAGHILESNQEFNQWSSTRLGPSLYLQRVAYANNYAMVVGSAASIFERDYTGRTRLNGTGEVWKRLGNNELEANSWLYSVLLDKRRQGLVVGSRGTAFQLGSSGAVNRVQVPSDDRINDIVSLPNGEVVAVGPLGSIYRAPNRQQSWQAVPYKNVADRTDVDSEILAVSRVSDNELIAVGDDGLILRSEDAGRNWRRQSIDWRYSFTDFFRSINVEPGSDISDADAKAALQNYPYSRYPAIWYWLFCLLVAFRAFSFAKQDPIPQESGSPSVTDALAPDRPLQPDQPDPLDFGLISRGLSRFMRNPSTEPPLTVAVTGQWGTGKSSMMNLLYHDLKQYGFTPVWFNAWHHQKGEQLLASLYANIRAQAIPRLFYFSGGVPIGIIFRLNLLLNRMRKNRFTSLVLFLVFLIPFFYFAYGIQTNMEGVWAALQSGQAWDAVLVAILGSTPLAAVLRTMQGFGLNPMRLVSLGAAASSSGAKIDPSARQKFADEFREVTQSLDLGRMVIFIDDLDRCSKENVVDILEAINFLSVSGDCYIVLGMDEKWVKLCVRDHFEKIAKDDPSFADHYLEKMVNIRVPVPSIENAGVSKLLAPAAESVVPARSYLQQVLESLKQQLFRFRIPVLAALVVIICYQIVGPSSINFQQSEGIQPDIDSRSVVIQEWNGVQIEQIEMHSGVPRIVLNVGEQTREPELESDTLASSMQLVLEASQADIEGGLLIGTLGNDQASADLKLRIVANPSENVANDINVDADKADDSQDLDVSKFFVAQTVSSKLIYFLPLFIAFILIYGAIIFARKRPGRIVLDSAEFGQALSHWQDWIVFTHSTPRALKRFLNRVRYIAMRYRSDEVNENRLRWKNIKPWFSAAQTEPQQLDEDEFINEAGLVALSAIYSFAPSWISDDNKFLRVKRGDLSDLLTEHQDTLFPGEPEKSQLEVGEWAHLFSRAPLDHVSHFGSFISLAEREKFLQIVSD